MLSFSLGVPQLVMIAIYALNVILAAANNGRPQGNYNVWATTASAAILLGILYWGGFFS